MTHKDTIASEVISSSLGGVMSASILYPLEVLKTRMQASDNDDDDGDDIETKNSKKPKGMLEYAKRLYEEEGIYVYLKGIETSAFQSGMEKAFYFFAYTALKEMHQLVRVIANPASSSHIGTLQNLALGCLAEWAHLPITLPIDCLTTALQTSKKGNAMALMMTLLKEGGMYKGITAYYVLCFKPALQYTVYEQVKAQLLRTRREKTLSAAESFILGMIARTVATVAVFPFVRAKVVMQSRAKSQEQQGGGGQQAKQQQPQSVTALLAETYEARGIAGLYQGLGPELTRGVFSAALMLMIKEKINESVKAALYGHARGHGVGMRKWIRTVLASSS